MICTERLLLRRAVLSDLADLHDVMRHPQAMRYWSTPPHPDLATTSAWLARLLARDPAASVEFVVVLEGRVIGTAGGGTLPEVGYILHPDHWGKGLAREAMRAVIAFAFANHPVDHLTADVDPRNDASIRLLQRLGFEPSGHADNTFCIDGEWVHSDYYRLTRPV
jgi:[ribosomal protein S5]-alanine N-acetyltransferase